MTLKILHVHYFGGSGGKFVSNCLAMSGQVALANYEIFANYYQSKDIGIIRHALLDTIPESDQARTWLYKELGCRQLFGPGINNVKQGMAAANGLFTDVSRFVDTWLPIDSHTKIAFDNVRKHFTGHRYFSVLVKGDKEFTDRAIRLKWPDPRHCLDLDQWHDFKRETSGMRVDHVIDDWNPLQSGQLQEIEKLAKLLAIDYDNSMARDYITKYLAFHQ